MAAIIGGIMKAEPKKHLWQFLDGKFDSIIVWDSELAWDTISQVLMLIVAVVAVFPMSNAGQCFEMGGVTGWQ